MPTQVFGTVTTATSGRSPEFRKGSNPNPVEFVEDLLRSPTASQGEGGALGEDEARRRGNTVGIRDQAMDLAKLNGEKITRLPTPVAMDAKDVDVEHQIATRNSLQLQSITAILNMPKETWVKTDLILKKKPKTQENQNDLISKIEDSLLPTTTASDWKGANHSGSGSASSRGMATVVEQTNWGKFEPAIKRWEQVIEREAPAPTKPDGKDGAHRLSSRFTEWMMGLPDGWITDCGLSRNDELKACGNGVVPQQAELALRILLDGLEVELEEDRP